MGQQVLFNYLMISPKVPNTLLTPSSYHMGHHSHSFVSKNDQNSSKQVFDDIYLYGFLLYTQVCSIGQQVVLNYPMVSPEVPSTLKTPYRYNMGHYSHSFVIKNGWKQVFDVTYLHNLLFYTQVYCMGQEVVFKYFMLSPKVHLWPKMITLWGTIATHLWAKNGRKWLNVFLPFLLTNEWL
jgi:hypothetical protein